MQDPIVDEIRVRFAGLSRRAQEIARLVATGLSNHEIGEQLGISPVTVKNYVSVLYAETGLSTRVRLARWLWDEEQRALGERLMRYEHALRAIADLRGATAHTSAVQIAREALSDVGSIAPARSADRDQARPGPVDEPAAPHASGPCLSRPRRPTNEKS